ncbi:MAG: YeeE/YedE family protein [Burkholderiaceae bacterium]
MTEIDVADLSSRVLWAAFGLAAIFGAIAQRTHFCTMGAVSDIVIMNDWTRARMWALAIAAATLGFNVMVGLGWIAARDTVYGGPRLAWLSVLAGGVMFGFGMVLASGCGSKNLVRLGGGNLKSLVVLLVLGVSAFATIRGITAVLRVNTVERVSVELAKGQDLPSLLSASTGIASPTLAWVLGAGLALLMAAWVLSEAAGRTREVWLGGLGIGAVIAAMWWVSGRLGHLAEDPNTLEEVFLATNSRRMEALSMVAPLAYALDWLMFFSDKSKLLTIGIVSMAGVVAGSAVSALARREFRWEGFANTRDLVNHLAGGLLMGVGGITALGCTVGQGLSGVSTLSLGSFIALGAIVSGALLALRLQVWRLERAA